MKTPGHIIIPLAGLICFLPFLSAPWALLMGIAAAVTVGNPYVGRTRTLTQKLLAYSVMGLGAGMDLGVVARVGAQGIVYTVVGISLAFAVGWLLRRLLNTGKDTSLLITVGTAICGGSAIAAVAPTIQAKHHDVSVALGIVFLLNASALFLFPWIGHSLHLSETQFGLWSALAIHDTSSVVGATLQYGAHALEVGTTVKLTRALWIVPLTLAIGYFRSKNPGESAAKAKKPWFILGFIAAAALVTWIPPLRPAGHMVEMVAKRGLVITLFLIGTNLTLETLRAVGLRPFIQGILLWLTVGGLTLAAIVAGVIQ